MIRPEEQPSIIDLTFLSLKYSASSPVPIFMKVFTLPGSSSTKIPSPPEYFFGSTKACLQKFHCLNGAPALVLPAYSTW